MFLTDQFSKELEYLPKSNDIIKCLWKLKTYFLNSGCKRKTHFCLSFVNFLQVKNLVYWIVPRKVKSVRQHFDNVVVPAMENKEAFEDGNYNKSVIIYRNWVFTTNIFWVFFPGFLDQIQIFWSFRTQEKKVWSGSETLLRTNMILSVNYLK